MKILITGGSGFVGKFLIEYLRPNHQLYLLGRQKKILDNKLYSGYNEPYIQTDYSLQHLSKILYEVNPDVVLHLASKRPNSNEIRVKDYSINLDISVNLFESCLSCKIENIVYLSSKSVYSSANKIPWSEEMIPVPSNPYGLSKLLVDTVSDYYNTQGLKIKILRVAQVIGLGEREGYVLNNFISMARDSKVLTVYGKGIGERQYIYVIDLCRAIESAFLHPEKQGAFNVGMEESYSFLELARIINNVFDNAAGIQMLKQVRADESRYVMDVSKISRELNWHPGYNLIESFTDIKQRLIE